jgi:hypothetical protein
MVTDIFGAGGGAIQLDEAAIEQALPLISVGLEKYCWLQGALATTDVAHDRAFQTKFNGFYRVRRSASWQATFYTLFERAKSEPHSLADVLSALHSATGRVEASFASKLAASIDPGSLDRLVCAQERRSPALAGRIG